MTPLTARKIARIAHLGQLYGTEDYFETHVTQVASRVADDPLALDTHLTVAYLHDVLEDTSVTFSDLINEGLTLEQQLAMLALTRFQDENYENYIGRVKSNPIATLVKYHDLEANIAAQPPPEQLRRYLGAHTVIERKLNRRTT